MAYYFDEMTRKTKDVVKKVADRATDAEELVKLLVAIAGG